MTLYGHGVEVNFESDMEWDLSNSNICRLCGCTGENHIDIYSDCGECLLLQEKITVSANVVIAIDDTLPKKVCVECCEKLDSIYEFQHFCQETQEKLSCGDLYDSKDVVFRNGNELADEDLDTELLSDLTNDNSIITELQEEARTLSSAVKDEDLTGIENAMLQGDVASEVTIDEQESLVLSNVVPSEVETVSLENNDEEDPNEDDGSAVLGNTEMAEESEESNQPKVLRYLIISKPGSDGLDLKALPIINLRGNKKKLLRIHPLKSVHDMDSSVDTSVNSISSVQTEETPEDKEKSLEYVGTEKENIQKENNSRPIVRVRVPQSSLVSKEVEKVSAREFKCRICEKTFRWKHQCEYHIREHLGEKQFHCFCGKSFTTQHFLTRHEVSHDTLFLHLCQLCGKRFKTANQLSSHEKLHNNSRKYLCAVCGETFRYKQSLTFHAVKHTGKFEHICEICGTTFVRRHLLTMHVRSHLGEMPHKCPTCGKGFAVKSGLTRHLLVHVQTAAKKAKRNKGKSVEEVVSE